MTNTITLNDVVETYLASWNESDAERRRELVGRPSPRTAATSTR